jgi:hypothetical protein
MCVRQRNVFIFTKSYKIEFLVGTDKALSTKKKIRDYLELI